MKIAQNAIWKRKMLQIIVNDPYVGWLFRDSGEMKPSAVIDAWVDANINSLSDFKRLVKRLLYVLRFVVRHYCQ